MLEHFNAKSGIACSFSEKTLGSDLGVNIADGDGTITHYGRFIQEVDEQLRANAVFEMLKDLSLYSAEIPEIIGADDLKYSYTNAIEGESLQSLMVKLGKKEITFDKAQKQAFAESCITLFLTTICLNLKDARMCNILFNKETGEMNFIDPIFPWESRINRMVDFNDGEYKAAKSPLLALFDIFYATSTGNIKNGSNTEGRMKNLYGYLFKTVESGLKGDGKIIFQKLELIKEKLQKNIENPAIG